MKKFFIFTISAMLFFVGCATVPKEIPITPLTIEKELDFDNLELVWSDEFDGTELNAENWTCQIGDGTSEASGDGWGNQELQYYTDRPKNVRVENGELIITGLKERFRTKNYTSARLRTLDKMDMLYGRIEARIKTVEGNGFVSAFWMLPTDNVYGGWAASGEIDIVEVFGSEPHSIKGTIHQGGPWPDNSRTGGRKKDKVNKFTDDYHVYALEWEKDELRWYVDGELYSTKTSEEWFVLNNDKSDILENVRAPFDQRFHLILNLSIGGNIDPKNTDDTTPFPSEMKIDYVRVYR